MSFNTARSGQSANINRLFYEAKGDWILLLHDDDWLLPGAIEALLSAVIRENADIAYGKQRLATADGTLLPERTADKPNSDYYRTSRFEGTVLSPRAAALVQQFPNDGFLVRAAVAKSIRYKERTEIHTDRSVDYDYALRLCERITRACYVDRFTAAYRVSITAVSKKGFVARYLWPVIVGYNVEDSDIWAKRVAMRRTAHKIVPAIKAEEGRLAAAKFVLSSGFPFSWRSLQKWKSLGRSFV